MIIFVKNKDTLLIDDFKFKCSIGKNGFSKEKIEGVKNSLILDNLPIKLEKLIEMINIKFLKNKFLDQSNIKIGKYNLDLNSRKISLEDKSLNLTEREINLIIFIKDKKKCFS